MSLLERITAKGFSVTAPGCPPVLRVEPTGMFTPTQQRTIATHSYALLGDVLFPFVDHRPSLALVHKLGDSTLAAPMG